MGGALPPLPCAVQVIGKVGREPDFGSVIAEADIHTQMIPNICRCPFGIQRFQMGVVLVLVQLDLPFRTGEVHIIAKPLQVPNHQVQAHTAIHGMANVFAVDIVAGGFACLLVLPYRTAGCFLRVADHGQTILQADPVRHIHKPSALCLGIVVFPSILVTDRIETEMIVQMVFIQMSGDDNLESVAPQFLCGLYTDLMAKLRCDLARFEA